MQPENLAILRAADVAARTGLSRSTLYRMQKAGTFPHCVQVTPNTVGWLAHEVDTFLRERVAESRKVAA